MADATVAIDRLEALEILLQLAAQVALDDVLVFLDNLDDAVQLLVGQRLGADVRADLSLLQHELRAGRADAVDIRKRGFDALVAGDIDTKKTGHGGKVVGGLSLALLQARILFVDDVDTALPADNLAVRRTAFNGSANSHDFIS